MSETSETVNWNGEQVDEETFAAAATIAVNTIDDDFNGSLTRDDYLGNLGQQYDGQRDIYDVLGYPDEIEFDDYRAKYERDIGKRIVRLPAEDSWKHAPKITDDETSEQTTSFEKDVEKFVQSSRPWHYCRRTDVVAGIGHYAVLFIGFTDAADISEPVDESSVPSKPKEAVSHFEPFAQDAVDEWQLGKEAGLEPSDKRYNKPVKYYLDFGDVDDSSTEGDTHWVHHSRVLHVPSDGRDESDLIGTPRLKDVYNRLLDLEKTVGASAEIFWTGASPRYQFNVDTDNASDIPEDELANLDSEVQKLVHDMQNYIKTFNTDVEVISGEEVDPSGVYDTIMSSIAGTRGIPKRILTGSERGELASSQDQATWFANVENRRRQFLEPTIVRRLIDRLTDFGVLPEPKKGTYDVKWPNLFELNELEKTEAQANRAQAIQHVAPKGNTDLLGSFDEIMEYVINGEKPEFGTIEEPAMNEADPEVQEQFDRLTEEVDESWQ